jgi:hypothetical protein
MSQSGMDADRTPDDALVMFGIDSSFTCISYSKVVSLYVVRNRRHTDGKLAVSSDASRATTLQPENRSAAQGEAHYRAENGRACWPGGGCLVSLLSLRPFYAACMLLAFLAIGDPAAWAGERITLRNGFEISCDHHAQVNGHTRLFMSSSEDYYVEFASAEIVAIEQLPDSPALPQSTVSSAMHASLESPSQANQDARLSPADLREMLVQASNEHNLDVDLLISLVKAESGGNARAVSRVGARGLMQLMPLTASDLGVEDSFNPRQNLGGGSAYLNALLLRYHDNLALALAAYNAGPAAVDKYRGVPPYRETRAYVARVIHEFNRRVTAREIQSRQAVVSALQQKIFR